MQPYPQNIPVLSLSEYDEILWLSIGPKALLRPYSIIAIAVVYYLLNRNIDAERKLSSNCRPVLILLFPKVPKCWIFFSW